MDDLVSARFVRCQSTKNAGKVKRFGERLRRVRGVGKGFKALKILLVSVESPLLSVGLTYISAVLKEAGHQVHIYIYNDHEKFVEKLQEDFDFVATGGLSLQYKEIKRIVEAAKKAGRRTILGGGIVTSEPELICSALRPDYAVIGEGEETTVELMVCLSNGGNLSAVNGIAYFDNGQLVFTQTREQSNNLDQLPRPDYESFGYEKWLDNTKSTDLYDVVDFPREYPIITSRSCPMACTFCYHPLGEKYRKRSVNSIIQELGYVIPKYRINVVNIYDELFSDDPERVIEFCKQFRKLVANVPWEVKWTCQMRVSRLKDAMLDEMRDAGCYMVSYGFESYSPVVLNSMKKRIKPEEIHHAIHATLDRKISIQANFIFGDVAETLETAKETLAFWKEHKEAGILLNFIRAYPNSAIYQHCIRKGLIKDRLDFIENHMFGLMNMTEMSDDDFLRLRYLVSKYTRRYTTHAIPLKRTADSLTIRCPHCKNVVEYRNFVVGGTRIDKIMHCKICRKRFVAINRSHHLFTRLKGMMRSFHGYKMGMKFRQQRRNLKARIKGMLGRTKVT